MNPFNFMALKFLIFFLFQQRPGPQDHPEDSHTEFIFTSTYETMAGKNRQIH